MVYDIIINVRYIKPDVKKGSEDMKDAMATNTEYILKMVLALIDKCETLEELKASVEEVLAKSGE